MLQIRLAFLEAERGKLMHSVTSLQSLVAKKSCHGQTLINECSISDYPSNFEGL